MSWYTEGVQNSQLTGTILADSGPVAADDTRWWEIIASSTVAIGVDIVRRNAANNADVQVQALAVPINGNVGCRMGITLLAGERLILRQRGASLGAVSGSLSYA